MGAEVDRDERTVAVENASYRIGYTFISFAILLDVAYRSLWRNEAAWDLLAVVIAGGLVSTVYQARQHILNRSWLRWALVTVLAAAVVGAAIAVGLVR